MTFRSTLARTCLAAILVMGAVFGAAAPASADTNTNGFRNPSGNSGSYRLCAGASDDMEWIFSSTCQFSPGYTGFFATSPNGVYSMKFQSDGNLVVYRNGTQATWASGTSGRGATRMALQGDGNLVIYAGNTVLWASGCYNSRDWGGLQLIIQDDGNLVQYHFWRGDYDHDVVPRWSSLTGRLC